MEKAEILERIIEKGCHEEILERDIEVTWSSVEDYNEYAGEFTMGEEQKTTLKAGSLVKTYLSTWDTGDFVEEGEQEYYILGFIVDGEPGDIDGEPFWSDDACCSHMAHFWEMVWAGETVINV